MSRYHRFAVADVPDGRIYDGNLFFSSWGCLIVSLTMAISHYEIFVERPSNERPKKYLYEWFGFTIAALVVMSETSRDYKDYCVATDNKYCRRAVFGIVLGAVSAFFGLGMTFIKMERAIIHQMISFLFLVAWAFAAAYITFNGGPGVAVGVLYFSTWAALIFCLLVNTPTLFELWNKMLGKEPTPEAETPFPTVEGGAGKDAQTNIKVQGVEVEEEEVAETA